jgi:hypothetical protein
MTPEDWEQAKTIAWIIFWAVVLHALFSKG